MDQVIAWNDCFCFKIKESDLKKPSEEFITSLLLSYLKEFDYNIEKIKTVCYCK